MEPDPSSGARDSLLAQRAAQGDHGAYTQLVLIYEPRVRRLIARLVADTELVQDLAQETFINAYRGIAGFRGESQFYTWLYRIAINTVRKSWRERARQPLVEHAASDGDEQLAETFGAAVEPSTGETPESLLAAKDVAAAVQDAVNRLPPELQQALTLREIEGWTYEQIAQHMQCPIGTVRTRIFRAREAVSARLRPLLEHQSGKRW